MICIFAHRVSIFAQAIFTLSLIQDSQVWLGKDWLELKSFGWAISCYHNALFKLTAENIASARRRECMCAYMTLEGNYPRVACCVACGTPVCRRSVSPLATSLHALPPSFIPRICCGHQRQRWLIIKEYSFINPRRVLEQKTEMHLTDH